MKTIWMMTLALAAAGAAFGQEDALVRAQRSAAALSTVSAGLNEHVACYASQFFGALQVEFQKDQNGVRVRLQGHHAREAALSLNLPGAANADAFEVTFENDWCRLSSARLGVFSCEIPDSKWPRPTATVKVYDPQGNLISSTGTLAVFRIGIEATERMSAGDASGDVKRRFLELDASAISETENDKRAELRLPYNPQDCREK